MPADGLAAWTRWVYKCGEIIFTLKCNHFRLLQDSAVNFAALLQHYFLHLFKEEKIVQDPALTLTWVSSVCNLSHIDWWIQTSTQGAGKRGVVQEGAEKRGSDRRRIKLLPALEVPARRCKGERCLKSSGQLSVPVMAWENWDARGGLCYSKERVCSLLRRKGSLHVDLWCCCCIAEWKHKSALPSPCLPSSFYVP